MTDTVLKIEKACGEDWQDILELLESAGLRAYFSGVETHHNFYVVYEGSDILCTFAIDSKGEIGILKSFAVSKKAQGKGIGKKVANCMFDIAEEFKIKKLYATSWEAPEFWRKTIFNEISEEEGKDSFYKEYLNDIKTRFPEYTETMKHFLLEI